MSRLHLLTSAAQLAGEIVSGLVAGVAGILAYRSVIVVVRQRAAVALRSICRTDR